jgi:hypothetical protein
MKDTLTRCSADPKHGAGDIHHRSQGESRLKRPQPLDEQARTHCADDRCQSARCVGHTYMIDTHILSASDSRLINPSNTGITKSGLEHFTLY